MLLRDVNRSLPVTFRRVVKKGIQLSDGYQLQPGQQIALAARHINMDHVTMVDAQFYDPSRWVHERQNSASFSHSSSANLHFGLGRYACPGRFFASVCFCQDRTDAPLHSMTH